MRTDTIAGVALAIGALDFVWLALVAPSFYQSQLGALLLPQPPSSAT